MSGPKLNPEAIASIDRGLREMRVNMLAAGPKIAAAFQQMADAINRAEWKKRRDVSGPE